METWKFAVTLLTLGFHGSIVVFLIVSGKSDNSLHSSAMSWSYLTAAGILAAIGFGTLTPLISSALLK